MVTESGHWLVAPKSEYWSVVIVISVERVGPDVSYQSLLLLGLCRADDFEEQFVLSALDLRKLFVSDSSSHCPDNQGLSYFE